MSMASRCLVFACVAVWLNVSPASATSPTVVVGQIKVSFYAVTGAVVEQVLLRLGHPVVVREGTHKEMFPLVGAGEVDLLVAAWLPSAHAHYWEQYGDRLAILGSLYEGARIYWAVPQYVPISEVATIADLARPEVAHRMQKVLQGIGAGAGSSRRGILAIEAYGLGPLGYTYRFGSWQDRYHALQTAVQEQRWIVVPMGAPMFLNEAFAMRPLGDPKGIMGGPNIGTLVGPATVVEKLPRRTLAVLRKIHLDLAAVSKMDYDMVIGKRTAREAAQSWMEDHAAEVSRWFAE